MNDKKLLVKCPHCSLEFPYHSSEYRPFCSERCKMVDLGHWLQENYKLPATSPDFTEEDCEVTPEKDSE